MGTLSRVTAGMLLITATVVAGSMSALALLRKGTDGPAVSVLQKKLKINADGDFGDKTVTAVKKFQKSKGLAADGVVGDLTWRKLTGAPAKPILRKNQGPVASVKTLQGKLGLKKDGKFGLSTEKAVKAYQRKKGIVDNGVVESDMRYMLGWGR